MQEIRGAAGQYSHDTGKLTARNAVMIAVAISVLWHILMFLPFRIFIGKTQVAPSRYPRVSFVGSILEDNPEVSAVLASRHLESARLRKIIDESLPIAGVNKSEPAGKIAPVSEVDLFKEIENKSAQFPVTGEKKIPEQPFDKVMVNYRTYPSEIEGPARFREVVYKPDLPTFLRWDESLGVDLQGLGDSFEVDLKFWVSTEGKVESVERVASSGHPTVDIVAMRYLKGWQFAPAKAGEDYKKQWGTLKLNLKLEKADGR